MSYALFIAGSTVEYLSLFIFMLVLFRFELRGNYVYIALVSFIMSHVSFFTRMVPEIGAGSSYIQFALSIVVLTVLFRVPLLYSLLMNGAALVFGFAVQGIIFLTLYMMINISLADVQNNMLTGALTQLLSAVVFLAASWTVRTNNLGFDYVPTSLRHNTHVRGTNAVMVVVIGIGISTAAISSVVFRNQYESYVVLASIIFMATLPVFLYYSLRRDREQKE
ncbi:hypothetical protein EBB07_29805 [Paenibacillaceae bacterium]|nr:hypothetical protein EBB07_29805 [Paenibacillaceae bacterium]